MAGEDTNFGKIATEAGLSAIPGGLGQVGKLAKIAKGVDVTAKGLRTADKVAQTATDLAGALANIPGKMTAAGKADSAANKLLASQYGAISKPVARSVDLNNTVGQLAKYGITKPADAERIANAFTGGDGIVSKAVRASVGDASRVDTAGLRDITNSALIDNQIPASKAKSFTDFLNVSLLKLSGGTKGDLVPGAHPSDAFEVIKKLESKAADLTGKGGTYHLPTSEDISLAKVHTTLADELKDRLYGNANISKVLTPELSSSLKALHPGNDKWASFVDNTVMKSKDVGQLRSTMAPFVKISKAIGEADTNAGTVGGKLAGGGGIINTAVGATLGSDLAKRAGASVIKGGSTIAAKIPTAVRKTATAGLIASDLPGHANDVAPAATALPADVTDASANVPSADTTSSSGAAFTPEMLQALAIHDIQATGGKNLDKIATLDKLFGSGSNAAKGKTVSSATNQQIANATSGIKQIGVLADALKSNPGAATSNAAASILPGALGNVARGAAGTQNFDTARNEIVDVLARLRTGAAISKQEEAQYKGMLPSAFDSPQTIQHKLDIYRELFQGILERAQGGNSTDATVATGQ
jgi:hypothetical protein